VCKIVNDKKRIIRNLNKKIEGIEESIIKEEESKINNSVSNSEDELNQSKTYSLTDLI